MGVGIYGPPRRAGDGAELDGRAGGGGALRLRHECRRQQRFGDRYGHRHTVVATIPVGKAPLAVAVTPEWETRLRHEFLSVNPSNYIGDPRGHQHAVVATVTLPGGVQ